MRTASTATRGAVLPDTVRPARSTALRPISRDIRQVVSRACGSSAGLRTDIGSGQPEAATAACAPMTSRPRSCPPSTPDMSSTPCKRESGVPTRSWMRGGGSSAAVVSDGTTSEQRAQALVDTAQMAEQAGRLREEIHQLEADRVNYERDLEDYRSRV